MPDRKLITFGELIAMYGFAEAARSIAAITPRRATKADRATPVKPAVGKPNATKRRKAS